MEHNIEQEARPAAVRVLIADKNATLREDLREALENAGYEVIGEAANGVEAVLAAQKLHPHLVISDTYLPKQDGIAAAEIILRERIAPVILLTAQSDVEAVRRAARIGVHSYLVRPLHEAALIPAIEVALGQWKQQRAAEKRLARLQKQDNTRDILDSAKKALMARSGLTETEAHRFIQTRSMNSRRPVQEIAEAILTVQEMLPVLPHEAAGAQAQ